MNKVKQRAESVRPLVCMCVLENEITDKDQTYVNGLSQDILTSRIPYSYLPSSASSYSSFSSQRHSLFRDAAFYFYFHLFRRSAAGRVHLSPPAWPSEVALAGAAPGYPESATRITQTQEHNTRKTMEEKKANGVRINDVC